MTIRHPSFRGRVGVTRRDITPPVGIRHKNWGASRHEVAEGVHRPLTATVMTIQTDQDDEPLVLAALDLGWWRSKDDEWFVRGHILETLGLSVERLIVALSHTHSGPSTTRGDGCLPGEELVEPYLDELRQKIVEATRDAISGATEAVLDWTYGVCDLATNRDLPDGPRYTVGYNPDEPADTTLLLGRVWCHKGLLATVVNYACHPTSLAFENRLISPDFVGAMRERVEAESRAPCLFLQGASGELAPRDQYSGDPEVADRNGRILGHAVLSTVEQMVAPGHSLHYRKVVESGAPLAIWESALSCPSHAFAAKLLHVPVEVKALESASEIEHKLASESDPAMVERLRRKRLVRQNVGNEPTMDLSIWLWQAGEALFVGIPSEPYSDLQVRLRAAFPMNAVVAMNVANGHYGYLPPRGHYDRDIYSVWQTPFASGSLERVVEAVNDGLRSF